LDVTAWLTEMALERYAEAFAENDIDGETLAELTVDDLKELGVASLGHRKKIMAAIAAIDVAGADDMAPTPSTAVHARPDGERRQVTVLFADISGFTRMTTEQDAEEIHRLLNTYFEAVDGAIRQFGGSVDKHIGDAVMAVFGAPIAHSDDPERAIRAALDMHRAASELDPPVSIHIGIASGQVVASGTGSATHSEYTMTGESVNLASRLQDKADAGETLISDAVRRAVTSGLKCEEIADLSVKGVDQPVTAWRVHEFSSDGPVSDTPFVGRQAEIRQFTGALAATRDTGLGQAIYVRGEAGLGKTRLVEEFRALAEQDGFAWHAGQALDFGAGGGRDAIGMILRGLLDVSANADREARADSVTAAVAGELIDPALEIHLNDLLDIPQPTALRSDFDAMDRDTRARQPTNDPRHPGACGAARAGRDSDRRYSLGR
jgi:class 3 adenylate cyclase